MIYSADNAFAVKNYYGAAKLYEEVLKYDPKMYDVIWKVAQAFRLDNDYVNAAKYYKILTDKVIDKYPDAVFYYAQMLKSDEDFTRAQYFFRRYISMSKDKTYRCDAKKVEIASAELLACEYAWKQKNHPQAIDIIHDEGNINSVYSDFSPVMFDGEILYSSIRPLNDSTTDYKSTIYEANFNFPSEAEKFDAVSALQDSDVSNLCINKVGDHVYFTVIDDFVSGKACIYESAKNNGVWSSPHKLPDKINFPQYNTTQPFLVEFENKNNVLLFASDRPGGEGGYDIYSCEILPDNSFGFVKNIGRKIVDDERFIAFADTSSTINSPGDEITPFYNTNDSTLYFSSNYYKGMGAFDIFSAKGNFYVWNEVKNMGYPINSAQNDFYYKIFPDEKMAVFTSNRKSALAQTHQSCCNDIFYYNIEPLISEAERKAKEDQIRTETLIKETKLLVPISLYFHNDEPNPNSWDTITDYSYSALYFNYMAMHEKYKKEFSKGLDKQNRESAIDSVDYYFSNYVEENYNKLLSFTEMLKELLVSGKKIIITIKGYTSPLNTVEYNNNLAKRRISSLVNFFNEYENQFFIPYIQTGKIELEFVAFGKTKAASTVSDDRNDLRNSVYNPAAARERRIEIIAVEFDE